MLLITHVFVNFLAIYNTKHLKFRVKKFESHLVYRIEEYIIRKFQHLKANFVILFT